MEASLPAPPATQRRRKLKKEELAVLLSVVATAVVIVQRFLADNNLLLLPSQTMELEASVKATTLALSKLQMMLSLAKAVKLAETEEEEQEKQEEQQEKHHQRKASRKSSCCWFEEFMGKVMDDGEWRQSFRMGRAVFVSLLEILRPALEGGAIPAERKLGAALFRLAHGAAFKAVSRKFGMGGEAACCKEFYEVCKALQERLNHLFDFPSTAEGLNPIIEKFAAQGMPNCCGVVGCTHFLLERPAAAAAAAASAAIGYYERNGIHSVVMQGVVDAAGRFLDISVGWGGSLSPGGILPRTRLFSRVHESRELLHGPPVELLNGFPIPEYIIADPSYPLLPWLIPPYVGHPLSPSHLLFNTVHDHVRSTISSSFGILKSHWQLLSFAHRFDDMDLLPFIVAAACILHNFLINSNEPMPRVQEPTPREPFMLADRNEYAENIRDALAAHITAVARMHMDLQ